MAKTNQPAGTPIDEHDIDDDEGSTVILSYDSGMIVLSGDGAAHTAEIMRKFINEIGLPDLLDRLVVA